MPSDFAFRLSTYLTLAMACVCLAFSEWDLLPEVTVVAGLVVVLLVVTFKIGPRFELGLTQANRVGGVIAVVAGGWIAYQFANKSSLIWILPWPVSLLPYIGPLLMVLVLAKMFRPKHVGDWWALQGMALVIVGLAAAMAESAAFGVLLAGYTVVALWSVTAFYFRRTAGALAPVPGTDPGPAPEIVTPPIAAPVAQLRGPVRWLVASAAVAVPLFLVTPRSGAPRWSYATGGMTTGLTGEQTVDLTREGTIEGSAELAYEVRATGRDGRPYDDLDATRRWRAIGFNQYESGRWTRTDTGVSLADGTRVRGLRGGEARPGTPAEDFTPPDLGPNQITLEFTRVVPQGHPILLDPVAWRHGESPPMWTLTDGGVRPWWQVSDSSFRANGLGPGRGLRYVQLAAPPAEPDLGVTLRLTPNPQNPELEPTDARSPFQQARLPAVRDYAEQEVRAAVAAGRLPAAVLERSRNPVYFRAVPQDYEAIARVLCDHLRDPKAFTYSLTLERADKRSDPVEDFLLRTRTGHCQRFASALTMMLRSVGVPAAYVLGYKGCEPQGDGLYLIRQEAAHAWVEVLVPRPHPWRWRWLGVEFTNSWNWLSLDPTPDYSGESTEEATGWWESLRAALVVGFEDFILGYSPERQARAWAAARAWAGRNAAVLLAPPAIGLVLALVWLRLRKRRAAAVAEAAAGPLRTGVAWYDRVTTALAAAGLRAAPGATPREFADAVRAAWPDRPEAATVSAVTAALHRARYAAAPPTPAEAATLDEQVTRLEAALRTA